ncbi:hypothetical protein D3C84_531040 [compost metagenome]
MAAILGTQDQVEHADHVADLVVGEPDVEQRLVGALLDQPLTVSDQQRPLLIGRLGSGQRRVMPDQQRADLSTVQLLVPGHAGIAAVQDHAIVADGPALLRRSKIHRTQVTADRYARLLPLPAAIVGIKNVPALPDRHQPLPGIGDVQQRAVHGQCTGPGGQVQHIDVIGRLGDALRQAEHNA